MSRESPTITITVAGPQGSGKTSVIAELAYWLKTIGLDVSPEHAGFSSSVGPEELPHPPCIVIVEEQTP